MYVRRTHSVARAAVRCCPASPFSLAASLLLSVVLAVLIHLHASLFITPAHLLHAVNVHTLTPIPFPSPGAAARCVNVVRHGADPLDPNPHNARSFCMHATPVCVTSRPTEHAVGSTLLSPIDLPSSTTPTATTPRRPQPCFVTPPALTTSVPPLENSSFPAERPNCTALADAVLCAHGSHDYTASGGVCGNVGSMHLRDAQHAGIGGGRGDHQPGAASPEWLRNDSTLIVVPAYPYQQNVFHFAQTLAPLLHATATLPARSKHHVTVLFRGRNPAEYGEWHRVMATALFNRRRRRRGDATVTFDTFFEEDLSLKRSGFKAFDEQAATLSKPRNHNRMVCANNVILLGPRTQPDMWPFPGGSPWLQWPFIFENDTAKHPQIISAIPPAAVPALALIVRAAVHSHVALLAKEKGRARHTTVHWLKTLVDDGEREQQQQQEEEEEEQQYHLHRWLRWLMVKRLHSSQQSRLPLLGTPNNLYDHVRRRWYSQHSSRAALHGLPLTRHYFDVGVTVRPHTAWLDLPPRAVLYRKRSATLTSRVLCCGGERWMLSMLRAVTQAHGFLLVESHDDRDVPFTEQLAQVSGVGVVVGVHGANLVNAMLAPALGAVIEIVNAPLPCYVGGMNSGMGYWAVQPTRRASPEESNCRRYTGFPVIRGDQYNPNRTEPMDLSGWCNKSDPYRAMWLDDSDRRAVRESVVQAMMYVEGLHKRFGEAAGAVPVRYKQDGSDEYEVDWAWTR